MPDEQRSPMLVSFTSDLKILLQLKKYCQNKDYRFENISEAEELLAPNLMNSLKDTKRVLGEPLVGQRGILIEKITGWRPVLLIFDIDNERIPWRKWLPLLRSVPATRRIPALAFGKKLDLEVIHDLKERGANLILESGEFLDRLPYWIGQTAVLPDYDSIERACQEPLSELAIKGLETFNHRDYFEAHELLEEAWNADGSAGREMYRAILQVAVAYLQIERENYHGALKMFLRVRQWIDPLPRQCRGVNIERLRDEAKQVYEQLVSLGPERISDFDFELLKPVHYELV